MAPGRVTTRAKEGSSLRTTARVLAALFVASLVGVVQPATSAQASSTAAAPHRSVGSRIDAPLAPAKSKAVTRVPYRVPDQAAFARAKRDAAGRAGPTSYTRSDFTINATPSSGSVVQGANTTFTVNTTVASGSARPVTFSVSGLPAGATGTFSPASVQAGVSSTLTVATTSTAQIGTFTLTISGNYSSPPTTHTTTVSLMVTPGPDFSIGAEPSSQGILRGEGTTYSVSTLVTSGSAQTVTFSLAGLPAGASGTFSPAAVLAGGGSTLTVTTSTSTPAGTFTLTISGAYANPPKSHSATVTLTVNAPVVDDFSISAAPASQNVVQGQSTTYTVTTQVTSGNAQTVTLSVSGLPAGATGTFSPSAVVAGGSSTLTVTTSVSTPTGTFTLTISGSYANPPNSRSATVTLTVNAPDDFGISASPLSQSVVQGQSTSYTVTTQVTSGNAQTVTLSVSGLPAGATGTFNPASVTAGGASLLTVTTTTTAATGTVTLVITGTYPSSTAHSTSVSFTVTLPPDEFSLAATPTLRTVAQGASTTYNVDTQLTSGNAQSVSLSVSGLPNGATGTFNPATVTTGASSVLTVATTTTSAVGTFNLTLIGQGSAGPTHAATVSLEITAASSGGPTVGVSWNGQFESDLAPPDPTGAMGPTSYIEAINLRYGIYGRDGALINEGDLGQLTRFPVSELSDPQIVWDPTSQRFYYLAVDFYTSEFAFGYSKTADPRSDDEFCHYQVGAFYNSFYLPDYPKLAVTRDFVLVGSNVFLLLSYYVGSDVNWFAKPTDPVCPGQLGGGGTFSALKNADGSLMSTPEPAVMLDATSGGWIVGTNDVSTSGGADYLTVFKVTKSAQGQAQLSAATTVKVPRYQMPANAPQSGTTQLIDTMDTRLTHAVAGYDPRLGATAIWTAHTAFGGAGSEVRWFEINTATTPVLSQTGTVTDPELYSFNGAISSDRAADDVTTTAAATGRNMVMGFNTSSAATFSAIKMVSRRGTAPQSGVVLIKQSPGPYVDFACGSSAPDVCRWGDYGGASPDPLSANGGQVWLSNEWNEAMTDGSTPTWRTWNWSARP